MYFTLSTLRGLRCTTNRDKEPDLGGSPVDPALSAGVHVDQHQALHQGGVIQLGGRGGGRVGSQ